ncbi:MAG: glucose-1-phosphate thymidylyltransferase [Candidatus Magnetominusculus sp. LBB02]|nr:glucose-1-phosphate thymidylyltransferase [Candidatus Magnetominusculus sp. LBB02]
MKKALILSGGQGTRLRPLTHTIAKQLVPVAGKPILGYVFDHICEAKIKNAGIIISPETGQDVRDYLREGKPWDIKTRYIVQKKPLGLAHAVLSARSFLKDDDFVMYLGDNLLSSGVRTAIARFKKNKSDAMIFLKEVEDPRRFGVARLDSDGKVIELMEKPQNPPSNLALVGVYIFTKRIFDAIARIKPSQRGELEITDAIQELINMGYAVDSEILDGWWLDTGKKDDLLQANCIVLDEYIKNDIKGKMDANSRTIGRVTIEAGSVVTNSNIRGPVKIGKNSIIENTFIGSFTSIGDNVTIKNSAIEHSVILDNACIDGIERLEDSLIGRGARVIKSAHQHKALRLMISDDSIVEV